MDFRKFGTMIAILGIIFILYGGFQYISNQPKRFNTAESKKNIFGGRDDVGNFLNVQLTNLERKGKRVESKKIAVVGVIVTFIGAGIAFSAKKERAQ